MLENNDPPLHGQQHWNLAANASSTPGPSQARSALLVLGLAVLLVVGVVGYRAIFVETDPWCEQTRTKLANNPYEILPEQEAYDARCR